MINILYEDNHVLVVEKPINIPTQADSSNDLNFLTMIKSYIKEKYNKPGDVYIGLVHRLDRPVGGIMVFARTSKAAKRLSKQMSEYTFQKQYCAIIENIPPKKEGVFEDRLLKNGKTNMVTVDQRGKTAILSYQMIEQQDQLCMVQIQLKTGRSHQIRVQFASRGLPLYGDQRYNGHAKIGQQIALFAQKVVFTHPVTNQTLTFSLPFPKRKPFSYFES